MIMNIDYNSSLLTSSFDPESILTSTDKQEEGELLWNNVNTFAIPDDPESITATNTTETPLFPTLHYAPISELSLENDDDECRVKEESTAFNISWGGDDKPPSELHPDLHRQDEPIQLTRPLPKPRGIRKLPEPEPAPDGTIDEDTLKRRKNTDAARKSRMKKMLKVDQLEYKVNSLQTENAKLTLSNAVLESEKRILHAKEIEYKKRIKHLEDIMVSHGWDFDKKT
ncbi:MAG: hypothetical protein EXX96DRAFT_564294 [Benjaminiella poitrasii]|nr:MAG: hypothetical protein EXX96DRAFT_564294 [Benjaminiella poitrasii]